MAEIANRLEEKFSYGDYRQWVGDERWELIGGEAVLMSPAPFPRHQIISREIMAQLTLKLRGKSCRPYNAPFDVLLPGGDESDDEVINVLQPDIFILCDKSKMKESSVRGAPDVIIEILSPSTKARDLTSKAELYANHGVREYWIVDPDSQQILARTLDPEKKWSKGEVFKSTDSASFKTIEGLNINLQPLFEED